MEGMNETFIVKVLRNQNHTWQGSITWTEKNETQYFRSALELLHLMGSALETGELKEKEENIGKESM